ncbi:MAG: hypothetical protein U0Q16_04300 [Bryobacteraceae bacterium]
MPALSANRYATVIAEHRYVPKLITSASEYSRARTVLENLLFPERRLSQEEDALAQLLLHLIDVYETQAFPAPDSSPRDALRHLMDQRGLKQVDLIAPLGAASIVSEILSGKRDINARQARRLADFFGISAGVFV